MLKRLYVIEAILQNRYRFLARSATV